jgi:hypothetical protein
MLLVGILLNRRSPMAQEFVGRSLALSADGMAAGAASIAVQPVELWTVLGVETSGWGFQADRRPKILYERHIFHRLTGGQFDDGDISDPTPGGYGAGGAHQYDRLARAIALNRGAALQSASWGVGQIMGMNFAAAGFGDVEAMVTAMCDTEDAQLAAVAAFLKSQKLDGPLRTHDWAGFASGYNGPAYKENHYDENLQTQFEKYSAGTTPDLTVRSTQLYLTFAGLDPGKVDGVMGPKTRAAITSFQGQQGLAATGVADEALLAALIKVALA